MELYDAWILNDIELNICVRMLGYTDWYNIEVEIGDESLEAKMTEGFFGLIEKGLLCISGNDYQPTERMKELILPVADPDKIINVYCRDKSYVFFWKKGKKVIGIGKIQTEKSSFQLLPISEEDMLKFCQLDEKYEDAGIDSELIEFWDDLQTVIRNSRAVLIVLDGNRNQQKLFRIFKSGECCWLTEAGQNQKEPYSEVRLIGRLFE